MDFDNWHFDFVDNINDMVRMATDGIANVLQGFTAQVQELINSYTFKFDEFARRLSESMKPFRAIQKLSENQYVYWDYLSPDFIDSIIATDNVNKTLRELHLKNKGREIQNIIEITRSKEQLLPYTKLYSQSVAAFDSRNNELALIGLLSVMDGILSDVSKNDTTSIFKRADAILKKIEDDDDVESDEFGILALTYTFRKTMESLSANSDFSKKEPKNLNRHWIMHGRSRRMKTKLDCIKIIRFIYGIILIDELSRKEAETSDE